MKIDLNEKGLLITGGTGSFGRALVDRVLKDWPGIGRLVIFSRDEQKQFEMAQEFSPKRYPCLRYFIGDVRDRDRLNRAVKKIDYIVHAAAMKHVPIAEYNPDECVKTNIVGAQNVIHAALESNVSRVVALSTDKACAPINLYGATKLVSDKLFVAANNIRGDRKCVFSVVRYGNVMGSNGSVMPFFIKRKKDGVLPITHSEMTRFNISLADGVELVLLALEKAWGGEIFVPKIPSYRITEVAKAIGPGCRQEIVGVRPGEKIHEEMISSSDSHTTYDIGPYYVILPQIPTFNLDEFLDEFGASRVQDGFCYNSGDNEDWLTVEKLRELISRHVGLV